MSSGVRSVCVASATIIGASAVALAPTVTPPPPPVPVAWADVALMAASNTTQAANQDAALALQNAGLGGALYQTYNSFVTLPAEYGIQLGNYALNFLPLPPLLVQRQIGLTGNLLVLGPLDSSVNALGEVIDGSLSANQLLPAVQQAFARGSSAFLSNEKRFLSPPSYPNYVDPSLPNQVNQVDKALVQPMDFAESVANYALGFLPVPAVLSAQMQIFYDALTSPLFGSFGVPFRANTAIVRIGPSRDVQTGLVYDLAEMKAGQETAGQVIGNLARNITNAAFTAIGAEITLLTPPPPRFLAAIPAAANAPVNTAANTVTVTVAPAGTANAADAPVRAAGTNASVGATNGTAAASGTTANSDGATISGNKAEPGKRGVGSSSHGKHAKARASR